MLLYNKILFKMWGLFQEAEKGTLDGIIWIDPLLHGEFLYYFIGFHSSHRLFHMIDAFASLLITNITYKLIMI